MISNDGRGDSVVAMINSISCANTAAATSGWIDVRPYKGNIGVTVNVGAVTGSITGKLQTATDSGGTGAADITGATFTAVSATNAAQKIFITKHVGPFIRYVGTIVTGPCVVSVTLTGHPAVV
jgi:hypothetical protein